MRERLRLLILSPVKTLLEAGDVSWVQVRLTDEGWLGIYPGHAPLLAETLGGSLRYADDVGEHEFDVLPGILHVREGEVVLFIIDSAYLAEEVEQAPAVRFDRLARGLFSGLNVPDDAQAGELPHDAS
ncbi:MAG: hypothetical protein RBT47_04635 [Anaerolineae bacterium]|nr:hypothetical protein [Anaerolineae bacterium]